jgi:urease accessory protein UreF
MRDASVACMHLQPLAELLIIAAVRVLPLGTLRAQSACMHASLLSATNLPLALLSAHVWCCDPLLCACVVILRACVVL